VDATAWGTRHAARYFSKINKINKIKYLSEAGDTRRNGRQKSRPAYIFCNINRLAKSP
jgi:hypothetical protein